MNASGSTVAIAKALATVQPKIVQPVKDRTVTTQQYSYSYATLDAIMAAVREPLGAAGLSVVQCLTTSSSGDVLLETTLLHESGEHISSLFPVRPVGAGPQAMGSAISYARRYSVAALLGVVAEDDDDGARAERTTKQAKREAKVESARQASPPRAGSTDLMEAIRTLHASNAAAGCIVPATTTDKNHAGYMSWLRGLVENILGQPVKSLSALTPKQVDEARIGIRRMLGSNEVLPWKGE